MYRVNNIGLNKSDLNINIILLITLLLTICAVEQLDSEKNHLFKGKISRK